MTATFTEGVQASLAPWGATGSDWQNSNYALGQMFEAVYQLVYPQGTPDQPAGFAASWSTLLNVDTCPTQFLPFLGMFVGVYVPPGTPDATARALIASEQGVQRGTLAAIEAAALRNLTGASPALIIRERTAANGTPDAYHMIVGFLPSQCPSEANLIAAVEAVKPAGIQISYIEANGWAWAEAVNNWQADTFSWNAAFFELP
jgi:hypothetical protein